jgi:hypothetical protein
MTIEVIETEEGFEISWDPEDPIERGLNDLSEQELLQIILKEAERIISEHEIAQKSSGENTFEQEFMAK